jgi:hypothetical protein
LNKTSFFRLPAYLCDIAILILASLIVFVLITGGGVFDISNGLRVRVQTISNPLLGLYLLLILRSATAKKIPFLARKAWDLSRLTERAALFGTKQPSGSRGLSLHGPAHRPTIIGLSVLIKVLNAWFYFGFFSGDDVRS